MFSSHSSRQRYGIIFIAPRIFRKFLPETHQKHKNQLSRLLRKGLCFLAERPSRKISKAFAQKTTGYSKFAPILWKNAET
jgi:hypothetical protein